MLIRDDQLLHGCPAYTRGGPLVTWFCSLICLAGGDHRYAGMMANAMRCVEAIELDNLEDPECRPVLGREAEEAEGGFPGEAPVLWECKGLREHRPASKMPRKSPNGNDPMDKCKVKTYPIEISAVNSKDRRVPLFDSDHRSARDNSKNAGRPDACKTISVSSQDLVRQSDLKPSPCQMMYANASCFDLRDRLAAKNYTLDPCCFSNPVAGSSFSTLRVGKTQSKALDSYSTLLKDGEPRDPDVYDEALYSSSAETASETTGLLPLVRRSSRRREETTSAAVLDIRDDRQRESPIECDKLKRLRRGKLEEKTESGNAAGVRTTPLTQSDGGNCDKSAILRLNSVELNRSSVEFSDAPSQNSQLSDSDSPLIDAAATSARSPQRHPVPRRRPFVRRGSLVGAKKGHVAQSSRPSKMTKLCKEKLASERPQAKRSPPVGSGHTRGSCAARSLLLTSNKPGAFKSSRSAAAGGKWDNIRTHAHLMAHPDESRYSPAPLTSRSLRHNNGIVLNTRQCDDSTCGHCCDAGFKNREFSCEFTVIPVTNDGQFCEGKETGNGHKHSPKGPSHGFDVEADQSDTLTQNSITSLLSSKFRDVAKRWKQYGVDSPRFRKRLHSKWESMNYEIIDSQLQRKLNEEKVSKRKVVMLMLSNWMVYFAIGIGTALMAAGVQIAVELIAHQKFSLLKKYLDKCSTDKENCLYQPILIWMSLNAGITLLGSSLVTFLQPMAAGSGIPLIKSYLNGVRIPGLLSLHAFIAKCVGVVLSILGGLACGKEGPMAHSGAIIAAGIGKGRMPWFKKHINLYGLFRTDHNIRDLVAAGAASGVSAAFGAPVGGTLFSVEEAASFWNTELVWKVFFSAMVACFSTNFLLSAFEGHPTQLSNPGLVRFNTFPNLTFDLIEIPVFIIMAAIGGLIGSLFVVMNYKLTIFRQKYLHRKKWIKIAEATLVSIVSAIAAFLLMFTVKDCTTATAYNGHSINTTMGCGDEGHNAMSTMFLTTPEGCLKALLHDPYDNYSVLTLVLFVTIFFLLGVWTYGLSVSSGVFIPSLTIGAAWGRLIGLGVIQLFPNQAKDVGKYALIGAASQLGGCLRTTISLTVIIVECTGDITFGLCIMLALMISKWVGDFFTTGLYDMNVEVSGIPLLSWEPPPLCEHVYASDFMSQPVMTFLPVERVGHVYECLMGESFNGFPVIEQDPKCGLRYKGKLRGIILRYQIMVLLNKKVFCPEGQIPANQSKITLKDFQKPYPVPLRIEDIVLSDEEKQFVIDFRPFMNQTPYSVSLNFSMPRVFRLFRGLGLRHLVVVNDEFEPIGMVTRKDLAKYRAELKKGMLHMEHLTVENR